MNRRDFLKVVAASSLALVARRIFPQAASARTEVGVVRSPRTEAAVLRAIELVGGIRRFVKPGDVVVVKPNMSFNAPPEMKATTDPLLVRTVVDLCFQARAAKVYVFDRSVSNSRLTYVNSGIEKAARAAGASVLYVDEVSPKLYKQVRVAGGTFLEETLVNRYVLESDVLINLPVAKQHSTAGLTIGMKNLMGITGDNRSRWHWKIHDAISDINTVVRSHLTVVDATAIMVRNGPTGGRLSDLRRTDTIIAAANVAQADAEAAALFGWAPSDLGYLQQGQAKGVGSISGYSRTELTL